MSDANCRPETCAPRGLVASPHALASDAGLQILRRGGNALDAAIAAAATIAVVYPHMNGLGGDNFWLVHDARRRRLLGLNAAGRAAAAATLESYRAQGATIPTRGGAARDLRLANSASSSAHSAATSATACPKTCSAPRE